MACKKFERWISDAIDGRLASGKRRALARHLEACAACRGYEKDLALLQSAGKNAGKAVRSEEYWDDFGSRLAARLTPPSKEKGKGAQPLGFRWKWALAGAPLFILIAAGLIFFLPGPSQGPGERYIFSVEDSLADIYLEIGDDAALEHAFNQTLIASIGETLWTSSEELNPLFEENALFWEGLTNEEMLVIERGLQIEVN